MKTIVTLCAMLVCCLTFAGEPMSVLNHSAPTAAPAAAPAVVPAAQPAPAPVVTGPALVALPRKTRCANGQCQLYTVEEQSHEYVRNRVFGGHVIRKGNRTVLRPVR